MQRFLCLMLLSGILSALMPEGNVRYGVRLITGMLGIKVIAEFLKDALLKLC